MKAHILQHVPFETPGVIMEWLAQRAAQVSYTRFYTEPPEPFPDLATLDLLVVMGGPMSVHDEDFFPWLADEKRFIAQAVAQGVAVLGICLGAQLIASAHGAPVRVMAEREIGWFEIVTESGAENSAESGGATAAFNFPARATVLHWHGETFELPAGAQRLASSAACVNQAFQLGNRVIGLQFHLEMTAETLAAIVEHCGDELEPDTFVQDEESLLAAAPAHFATTHALMAQVLDYLTRPDPAFAD